MKYLVLNLLDFCLLHTVNLKDVISQFVMISVHKQMALSYQLCLLVMNHSLSEHYQMYWYFECFSTRFLSAGGE